LASIGSGRSTPRRVTLCGRRKREGLERDPNGVAFIRMSDDRAAVADADEPGTSVSVDHGLVRLKGAGGAKLQLQEFRTGDRVQTKRVHTRKGSARFSLVLLGAGRSVASAGPNWRRQVKGGRRTLHRRDPAAQSRAAEKAQSEPGHLTILEPRTPWLTSEVATGL
jgi:hypothetical protein